ncbi:MAG: flagellar basal body P-ring formation chaperone FlgA [Pseudomonadota bacterium]|nr:flagellar basal body P-ring formation chaperone FlgA [Pseudomonadota bacterium]
MKFPSAPDLAARSSTAMASTMGLMLIVGGLILGTPLRARAEGATGESIDAALIDQVRELALHATQQTAPVDAERVGAANTSGGIGNPTRFDVVVGTLDPRLKLAPCLRIEPYLPPGARLWGKTRIGLRCAQGVRAWNVYLPITVRVYGTALVATQPLPAGATLREGDLKRAEIDLAEDNGSVVASAALAIGRMLARPLAAGQGVRETDLKARLWFAAGDTVKVLATGNGFSVAGSGQALTAGLEGQTARVRTDGGQVITGMPIGTRQLEVSL